MIVNLVYIRVKEPYLEAFIRASIENHNNTIQETGNLRFDILRDSEDPAKFIFYEAFRDDESAAVHKATSHYKKWRDTVAEMMAEPRKGVRYNILQPDSAAKW